MCGNTSLQLPFFTADRNGPVSPGMPPANEGSPERVPWGRFVTWNGGDGGDKVADVISSAAETFDSDHVLGSANSSTNSSWSPWDVLFTQNIVLEWNDVGCCNRQGLDGGVIESWGVGKNCTWAYNAVHDSEVRHNTTALQC